VSLNINCKFKLNRSFYTLASEAATGATTTATKYAAEVVKAMLTTLMTVKGF